GDKGRGSKANKSASDSSPPLGKGNGSAKGKKDRKEVQQLLNLGRTKGFLTYDEVNEALPPEMVTSDQIDDLMVQIGDASIDVVDSPSQYKGAAKKAAAESREREAKASRTPRRGSTMPPGEDEPMARSSSMPPADADYQAKPN